MAGDEGGLAMAEGRLEGRGSLSWALVADVEAGFETRQYILHEIMRQIGRARGLSDAQC